LRTTLENSPTKERLLDAAQGLILAEGFVGTTVDDICRAAQLTKGSFFHYFDTKEALGVELLSRYCANSKEAMRSGCCQEEKDPLKRIYRFLDFMIEKVKQNGGKGCLVGSMAQELSESHPEIRSICGRAFQGMAETLKKSLEEAKAKYAPKASWDPASLADHFVVVLEGTHLVSKVKPNASVKESGLKHYKEYLKALFKR